MPEATVTRTRRRLLFGLVVLACVAIAAVSMTVSAARGPGVAQGEDGPASATKEPVRGALVFRSLDRSRPGRYGRLAWTRAPGRTAHLRHARMRARVLRGRPRPLPLAHRRARSVGARCGFSAATSVPTHELELPGVPSRARCRPTAASGR